MRFMAIVLQPSSRGARIRFDHGKRTVTDGPFAETMHDELAAQTAKRS